MQLRLLIDTSVWLDLAKDHRQLPIIEAMASLVEAGNLDLILPQTVTTEFVRNRDRVIAESKRSLSSHFRLVREAVLQFAPDEHRDEMVARLNEVDHRVAVGGEAVHDSVDAIEGLFERATKIGVSNDLKVRAADRAIARVAPFHRQRNSIDDAVLIEAYIDALASRESEEDVYGFVTHNVRDFSQREGDLRLPHPDLATYFNGDNSRYSINLSGLLNEFADDLIEVIRFEREYDQHPRLLSELLRVEHTLYQQVWYNRHWNLRIAIERGEHRLVSREEWESSTPKSRAGMTIDTGWQGALAAAERTEVELGPENIGPWSDFEWGMLNGKLSAIRWVLGDEWDMLDT